VRYTNESFVVMTKAEERQDEVPDVSHFLHYQTKLTRNHPILFITKA